LHRSRWLDDEFHQVSWALSVTCAAEHFDELLLVTDSEGACQLADQLERPFTSVSPSTAAVVSALASGWASL
jgi:hypothetical protein